MEAEFVTSVAPKFLNRCQIIDNIIIIQYVGSIDIVGQVDMLVVQCGIIPAL